MSADSPIIKKELREYVDILGYSESELLKKNREETKKLGPISIMQVGAAQGAFLSILCKCGKFKNCLEVGVFTGYSSLCISLAIENDSRLTVIDNNNEYLDIAKKYLCLHPSKSIVFHQNLQSLESKYAQFHGLPHL